MQRGEKDEVKTTRGILIIQEKDQNKDPLVDCTNNISLPYKNDDKIRNISLKRQWKRRVRMQANGIHEGVSKQQNQKGID